MLGLPPEFLSIIAAQCSKSNDLSLLASNGCPYIGNMTEKQTHRTTKVIAQNRKAKHDFEIISTLEAGIVLTGTEVKSLRAGKCNLQDSYVLYQSKHAVAPMLIGTHISPYDHGNRENHLPTRDRVLLLHDRESTKLKQAIQEKGMTVVPLSMYFSGPYVKVEIAVVRGKKLHDKREDLKKKDIERDLRRGE